MNSEKTHAVIEDEVAIRRLVDTWFSASASSDLDTVLSLMTDDVIFMIPGRAPFGKTEFAESWRSMGGARVEGKSDIVELVMLGDWAYLRNHLEVSVTPPNGEKRQREGYTLTILRKSQDGKWRLCRDANLLAPK